MKPWAAWILASAVFLALYDLAKKASVRDNAVLPTLLCSTTFGFAAFAAGLYVCGGGFGAAVAAIDGRVMALGLAKAVIVGVSWIFTFFALRTLPITVATPIRASSPALVAVAAPFLYGEIPTVLQAAGMLLVLAGYWAFSRAGRFEGIDFFRDKAVWCAFAGAVCSAGSSLWDKYVFQVAAAPVEATQLVFQAGLVAVYGACLASAVLARRISGACAAVRFEWRWTIPLVGVLLACADWLLFTGLALPETPVSIAAVMRRFSVVITFVLGAALFHETNMRRKSIALALVLMGTVLLCFV